MRQRLLGAGFLASALLAVTACGGTDSGAGNAGGGSATQTIKTIDVGVLTSVGTAPIHMGMDKGFFKEEGLKVNLHVAAGGAALIPGVLGGDYDFAYSNIVSLLLAEGKGLSLRIVANGNSTGDSIKTDYHGLAVSSKSDIKSAKDLVGKTIAVNTLANIDDIGVRAFLERGGVDPKSAKLVEVPFPDMPGALAKGQVDAAALSEPFIAKATQEGAKLLGPFLAHDTPNGTLAAYFTSARYVSENADVTERFKKAMERSTAYAQDHPDEVRAAAERYAKVPSDLAEAMILPNFTNQIDVASLATWGKLMVRFGLVDKVPDASALLK